MKPVIAMLLAVLSVTAAHAAWTVTRITDDFDHNDKVIARSDVVLGSPYNVAGIAVRCMNGSRLDALIWFDYLNFPAGFWSSKYGFIERRFWGNRQFDSLIDEARSNDVPLRRIRLTSVTRSSSHEYNLLFFYDSLSSKSNLLGSSYDMALQMMCSDGFAIRLPYQDVGDVTVRYNMDSARAAIGEVLNACAKRGGEFNTPDASPVDTLSIQRACERSNGGSDSNNLLEIAYCKRSVRYNPNTDRFEWVHSESRG